MPNLLAHCSPQKQLRKKKVREELRILYPHEVRFTARTGVHQIKVGVSPLSQDSGKPQHMGSQCPRSMLRLSDLSGRRGLGSGIVWGSLHRAGACQSRLPGQLELVKQEGQLSPAPGRPHTMWAPTSPPPLCSSHIQPRVTVLSVTDPRERTKRDLFSIPCTPR